MVSGKEIFLLLTQQCNLNCKYCFLGDKSTLSKEKMSFEVFKNFIHKLCKEYIANKSSLKHRLGDDPINIQFLGGEPTLYPSSDLERLLIFGQKELKSEGVPFHFSIVTNGTFTDPMFIDLFKRYDVSVCFSYDGQNSVRNGLDSYKNIFEENIKKCRDNNISLSFHAVATSLNIDTVFEDIKSISSLNKTEEDIKIWTYISPVRCNDLQNKDLLLSVEDKLNKLYIPIYEEFLKTPLKISKNSGFITSIYGKILYDFLQDRLTYHDNRVFTTCNSRFCGAGVNILSVLPSGDIVPCNSFRGDEPLLERKFNNVKDSDFLCLKPLILNLNLIKKSLPVINDTGCDICSYRDICTGLCYSFLEKTNYDKDIIHQNCEFYKQLYRYLNYNLKRFLEKFYYENKGIIELPLGSFDRKKPTLLSVGYGLHLKNGVIFIK